MKSNDRQVSVQAEAPLCGVAMLLEVGRSGGASWIIVQGDGVFDRVSSGDTEHGGVQLDALEVARVQL
jgi:hypothetical protein